MLRILTTLAPWLLLAASFAGSPPWATWLFVRAALLVWGVVALAAGLWGAHRTLDTNLRRHWAMTALVLTAAAAAAYYGWSASWFHPVWAPLAVAAAHWGMSQSRPALPVMALLAGGLMAAGAVEGSLLAMRNSVWLSSQTLVRPLARKIYRSDWAVAHLDPECAREDAELLYTLRPGQCRFQNIEFDTTIRVNRLGVRDDEQSLEAPDIVVVGDSQAMGWGVEESETFASRLERATGLRVLNTAISSYGTPRELTILKRVDLSRARYLVIQYSANDLEENEAFQRNGYKLPSHRPGAHTGTMAWYRNQRRYRPGKYLTYCMRGAEDVIARRLPSLGAAREPAAEPVRRQDVPVAARDGGPRAREMDLLVDVLAHSPVDLTRFQVLLFEMASHRLASGGAGAIRRAIEAHPARDRLANVTVLDVSAVLGSADNLSVDGHSNARAHEKVAAELARRMSQ